MKKYLPSGAEMNIISNETGGFDVTIVGPFRTFGSLEETHPLIHSDTLEVYMTLEAEGILGDQPNQISKYTATKESKGAKKHKETQTTPIFTTYLYSSVYDITYLQNAAKQAELLDRLNGVENTKIVAVTLAQLQNDGSLNLNPETDLIYEIRKKPDNYESDETGQTDMGQTAEDFQNKSFVGGFIFADATPPAMHIDKYSPTDLGIVIDHERIAHGFKAMVRSLFSSGTDPNLRLRDSKLSKIYGDEYSGNYVGIEKPEGSIFNFMGTAKYTELRPEETYSEQSKLTIKDLTQFIMAKPTIVKIMQEDEEEQKKDIEKGEYRLFPEYKPVDYKSFDYLGNPDYTYFLNEYFKNIDFNNPENIK